MRATMSQVGSFNRPIKLLLVNQLTINVGFYMLMPYLAGYLSNNLAMAAWMVGLILGMRNLSQQGMFLIGGSLADRIGYKPMILAGLGLRVAGFAMLGFAQSVPSLLVASALTGLAGALFNPAVRAYLAAEAGERKVEAFALFNVFYQAGILVGPLIGLTLLGVAFRWVCVVAAALFLVLLVLQARALPSRRGAGDEPKQSMLADWRQVVGHRPFLLFSLAMIGSYVLNFQVYLGLPIEVRRVTGGETGVAVLFAVSGVLTVAGQVRLTNKVKARWTPTLAITRGLLLMGASFVPLALAAGLPSASTNRPLSWFEFLLAMAPVLISTVLLTLATMIVYPFEMATIVNLASERTVATYYGFYNTLSGIGIAAGNVLTGLALDTGRSSGFPALPWIALTVTGVVCATAVAALGKRGSLSSKAPDADSEITPAAAPPQHVAANSR
ncbi:MFS transporter [Micromonospora sp. KC213]|uniref:MDR family MFS transporter n=1 Tax=Micromonospora sp. KC213 TaxID=2530378 RepID=UPI00104E31AA|nr:MFS transporter [Micromonospora sp. KC213]TDC43006.1 MFS transporter [Micromonospora sp. KC213]